MRVLLMVSYLLTIASPGFAYTVLWDKENTPNQMGYLYTQFQSFSEDAEYWAPQHNAGSDLDGDGTVEFVCFMGGSNIETYVIDSFTGNIEFTYSIPSQINERVMVVAYMDSQAADGVKEVLVQTLYRTFVISGGSAATAPNQMESNPSTLLFEPSVPNPFKDGATLRFQLSDAGRAKVTIFDASGRLVRSVFDGELPAGTHALQWDGRNDLGAEISSNVYYARLEVGFETKTRKIVLAR